MKSLIGKMIRAPAKISSFLRAARQLWRRGGVVNVNICVLDSKDVLSGKKVLVTGGSHGIGYAIVSKFINCGATVIATGRNEKDLMAASDKLSSDNFHWISWDVSDVDAAKNKLDEIRKIIGSDIDILVNNAGVLIFESFPNISESGWDKVYSVNSKGLFFLTQEVCRRWMQEGGTGKIRKIINISSTSGFTPGTTPYRMSKWDVVGMTQGLAQTLAPHGVVVNGIAPGRTAGRMLGLDDGNIFDPDIPAGRSAIPEEIAELALFLAGDASNYITGQTIICDGGMTLGNRIS